MCVPGSHCIALANNVQDEYWPSKCVYESELRPQDDPGEQAFNLSPGTDVRAELQRILKNGGGVPLAYRLMKDGLYQHTMVLYHAEKVAWPLPITSPLPTIGV